MAEELQITRAQLEALAAKLDGLELDDDERAVMQALFAAAGPGHEPEVAGYLGPHPPLLSAGFMNAFQPGGKVGVGQSENIIAILIG